MCEINGGAAAWRPARGARRSLAEADGDYCSWRLGWLGRRRQVDVCVRQVRVQVLDDRYIWGGNEIHKNTYVSCFVSDTFGIHVSTHRISLCLQQLQAAPRWLRATGRGSRRSRCQPEPEAEEPEGGRRDPGSG